MASKKDSEPKATKKMTKYDWELIKVDYITSNISIRQLCQKYDCPKSTLQYHMEQENWKEQKNKFKIDTLNKAVDKIGDTEADILAVEWAQINDIEKILSWAIKERENFTTSYFINKDELKQKFDFDALLKATKVIETLEKLKRNIKGVLREEDRQNIEIKKEYLKLEQDKNKPADSNDTINIIELPQILEKTAEEAKENIKKNNSGEGAGNG